MADDKKHLTPEQLRQLTRTALARVGKLTPELDRSISETPIPARADRLKMETQGMSEVVWMRVRAEEMVWFATHPTESVYYRRVVPGELPPEVTAEWVRVTRIDLRGDARVRELVVRVIGPKGLEWRDWKEDAK